jgi:hypothetical protein
MRNTIGEAALIWVLASMPCLAVEDSLVGSWRFDTAAASVADLSGHGHAAQVSGGKIVLENGKKALALDGSQRIVVPSGAELNLKAGFSIELKVKIAAPTDYATLIFKEGQYQLRIDAREEGGSISFFPYTDGEWEPRTHSCPPALGAWRHLVATWDGWRSFVWVDGAPFSDSRHGTPPAPNDSALLIVSAFSPGNGIRGAIEYAKIYRRVLSPGEILQKAQGMAEATGAQAATTNFDFSRATALEGWTAREGATIVAGAKRLVVHTQSPQSLIIHNRLAANIDKKDFAAVKMSVDHGGQARLVYVTTKGAGQISFPIVADGKPHSYVIEPWTEIGWGGKLLALGLIPSELPGSTARIERLQVTEEPLASPEIQVARIFSETTFPRAERPDRIVARLLNTAGPGRNLVATLVVPNGMVLKSPAAQAVPTLEHLGEAEMAWSVEAPQPVAGPFRVTVSGPCMAEPASAVQKVTFHVNPHLAKSSYVPRPAPAKTKYTLWTHYCPLWKGNSPNGWKAIEPWPERKPVIGWYNEGTPEVADWHIKHLVEHGISGIVYCWYRSNLNGPVEQSSGHAIHDGLLKARYLSLIKFGIMWENGCGQGVGSAEDMMQNLLPFWIDNYFSNPSYARIDGKPVLYVWVPSNVTRHLGGSEKVRQTFERMRAECRRRGLGGLYIVGCVGQQDQTLLETMAKEGWDASSAYGASWRAPAHVTTLGDFCSAPFEGFIDQQEAIWKFKRQLRLLPDITAAMMGWDSRPWKETPFFWSDNTPEKFRTLCRRAKAVMDASPGSGPEKNTAIFCCWNEFGEGHYIEPTRGYGFSYLDVIREVFCDASQSHVDVAPEDVGLAAADSWYREAREAARASDRATLRQTAWSGEQLAAWTGVMGFGHVEVRQGILQATSTNGDPAFFSPPLRLRGSRFAKVIVDMRLSQPAGAAQLFWSTVTSPQTSEAASVSVQTVADGQWHSYTFDVGGNPQWGGCITALRFDPATQKGVTVELKSVRLE